MTTGKYGTALISITDSELILNESYFRRYSNNEFGKMKFLGSIMP